ncbi:MAG: response regulator [Desulfonatronovibrionaceae bacterium]
MNILIVEDQYYSRMVLQKMMKSYGVCHEAVDGKEAVLAFRRAWTKGSPYDLVLLDIMMPEMDGLEALDQIRDFEKSQGVPDSEKVRVVMLTALGDKENVHRAMYDGGADAYLIKPVHVQKLNLVLSDLGFEPVDLAAAESSQ